MHCFEVRQGPDPAVTPVPTPGLGWAVVHELSISSRTDKTLSAVPQCKHLCHWCSCAFPRHSFCSVTDKDLGLAHLGPFSAGLRIQRCQGPNTSWPCRTWAVQLKVSDEERIFSALRHYSRGWLQLFKIHFLMQSIQ